MEENSSKRPIIIIGCPRSGTLLVSRILGGCKDHFLITEHSIKNKLKYLPEDKSGIDDAQLWWETFRYPAWDEVKNRPLIEIPIYDPERINKIKNIYLDIAGHKRLVVKNPTHILYINFLKEMFPDAFFVFCVRNPWHVLQSMTIKGSDSFILRSHENYKLPDDLLLRAAFSWGEAIERYLQEKDESWIVAKYEDIVSNPKKAIKELYEFLDIKDDLYLKKASSLPRKIQHNYYFLKKTFYNSKYRSQILDAVKQGCEIFSYPTSPDYLESSAIGHHMGRLKKKAAKLFKLR